MQWLFCPLEELNLKVLKCCFNLGIDNNAPIKNQSIVGFAKTYNPKNAPTPIYGLVAINGTSKKKERNYINKKSVFFLVSNNRENM